MLTPIYAAGGYYGARDSAAGSYPSPPPGRYSGGGFRDSAGRDAPVKGAMPPPAPVKTAKPPPVRAAQRSPVPSGEPRIPIATPLVRRHSTTGEDRSATHV